MSFSIKEAFSFTFKTWRSNFVVVSVLSIISAVFSIMFYKMIIHSLNLMVPQRLLSIPALLTVIIFMIINEMVFYSLLNVCLYASNGSAIKIKHYFPMKNMLKIFASFAAYYCFAHLVDFLLLPFVSTAKPVTITASIIMSVIIATVTVILIFRYVFFDIRLLENEKSIVNALKYSATITLGNRNKMFFFAIMLCVMFFLVFIPISLLLTDTQSKFFMFLLFVVAFLSFPLRVLIKLGIYKQLSSLQIDV